MGYSIEDLSSSDDFNVHKVVQCCCTNKCCSYEVIKKEDDCITCQENDKDQVFQFNGCDR